MNTATTRRLGSALLLLLACWICPVRAADRADCLARVHSEFADAQRQLQRDLRSLIASNLPHLEEVATLNVDFQLKLIRQKEQRFRFLTRKYPDRLATVQGVMGLISLTGSWTRQDEAALLADDAGYWVLQKSIEEVQERTRSHPDWSALQEFFQSALTSSPSFRQAQKRLEAVVGKVDEKAAGCR